MLLENITNIRWAEAVHAARPIRVGQVSSVSASGFTAAGLAAAVGDLVEVEADGTTLIGRVVGLKSGEAVVSSYDPVDGLRLDMPCRIRPKGNGLPKADRLIGRVVNALGDPIDRQPVRPGPMMSSDRDAPDPSPGNSSEHPSRQAYVRSTHSFRWQKANASAYSQGQVSENQRFLP